MSRRFWMVFTGAAFVVLLAGALFFLAGGSYAASAYAQASTPTASAGIRTVLTGTPPADATGAVSATVMPTSRPLTVTATSMPLTATATVTPTVRVPRVSTGAVPTGVVRSITVIGDGMVSVQPDTANTNLGYEVVTDTVKAGTAAVSRTMSSILDALHGLGVADKDIQTSNYNISMDNSSMNNNPGPNPATGTTPRLQYRVSSNVSVTIHDLTKVGAVLDAAVNAGANSVYGVNFTILNQKALDRRAYSLAMDDADARAAYLADLAGVTLGPVISVSEVIGQGQFSKAGVGGGGGNAIQPGELQVDRQLEVVYSINK
jgi:uncharacterized protein